MTKPLLLLAAALFLSVSKVFAYPDLIRNGYVNCIGCHASPSGGGVLNDYGRNFSGEGLSTFARPGEESLLHGAVPRKSVPKWLMVGGDVRAVQVHHENDRVREGYNYFMQADFETAVQYKKLTLDVTAGRFQVHKEEPRFKSRRFFAMYELTDEARLRAGRFVPNYGLMVPDHVIATRYPLGFDEGLERYAVEASWIGDTVNFFITGSKGPVELPDSQQESALSYQFAYVFQDTFKVGINGWSGNSDVSSRQLAGFFANLGFSEQFHVMSEVDWQWQKIKSNDDNQLGVFTYNRAMYEIFRGVDLMATFEFWQSKLGDSSTGNDRYGIGAQLFPRPHFDIQAIWAKQKTRSSTGPFEDYAWVVGHYYL